MNSRWVEINGARLRYAHSTRSDATKRHTVVLVHEMGGAIETFDDIVAVLSEHWDILRYDQRGSGLSEKTRGTLDVDTLCDDLTALLDTLAITEPVTVVACALGAAVAVRFAAREPARISRLILMSPATAIGADQRDWALGRADTIESQGVRTALGGEAGHDLNRHEILRLVSDPGSLASYWRMLARLDLDASLAAIKCPVLVLAGEHDKVRYPARVRAEVASKIAHARFEAVESGHVMPVETPQLAIDIIRGYLDAEP